MIDACGATQVCAGHKSGSEAAIHATHNIFESDETDAVLLIAASNAFNSLNRVDCEQSLFSSKIRGKEHKTSNMQA